MNNVVASSEPMAGDGLGHVLYVTNGSSVPVRRAVAASGVSATPARAGSDSTRLARQRAATLRDRVAPGSIVADAQLGRNPPIAVGACLDPVAAARFELDRSLELVPEVAPVLSGGITLPTLPESLHDSEARTGVVVARWVVDTNGTTIPESVTIVSSPHGLMSVKVCGAILAAHLTPARDDGKVVRSRVEMPVRFVP